MDESTGNIIYQYDPTRISKTVGERIVNFVKGAEDWLHSPNKIVAGFGASVKRSTKGVGVSGEVVAYGEGNGDSNDRVGLAAKAELSGSLALKYDLADALTTSLTETGSTEVGFFLFVSTGKKGNDGESASFKSYIKATEDDSYGIPFGIGTLKVEYSIDNTGKETAKYGIYFGKDAKGIKEAKASGKSGVSLKTGFEANIETE